MPLFGVPKGEVGGGILASFKPSTLQLGVFPGGQELCFYEVSSLRKENSDCCAYTPTAIL